MTTRIYDSNEVAIACGGAPISGYADGDFLTISWTSDGFTTVVGTDGQVARSKTNDNRATIEVRLMSTSPSNAILSTFWQADKKAPGGAGIFGFICTDLNGTSLYTAGNAWVRRSPETTYGREASERVWQLECDNLQDFVGGNL